MTLYNELDLEDYVKSYTHDSDENGCLYLIAYENNIVTWEVLNGQYAYVLNAHVLKEHS